MPSSSVGFGLLHQIRLDERIDGPVDYSLHVGNLCFGAVIVYHGVGLKDVRPDLATPLDLLFLALDLVPGGFLDILLELIDSAFEHHHRAVLVLELAPLFRALGDNPRLLAVRERSCPDISNTRLYLVDVLSALAPRAKRLKFEVGWGDVDVDGVVDFRIHKDARERGMASAAGVEGGNSYQAMDAVLGSQISVGEGPFDVETGTLDAGDFAFLMFEHGYPEAVVLGPSRIHSEEHLGPVLALGSAGARVNRQDAIPLVIRAVEHVPKLEALEVGLHALDFPVDFAREVGIFLFLGEQQECFDILTTALQNLPVIEPALLRRDLLLYDASTIGIVPEARIKPLLVETFYFLSSVIDVKDSLRAC